MKKKENKHLTDSSSFLKLTRIKGQIFNLSVTVIALVVATLAWFSFNTVSKIGEIETKARNLHSKEQYFCFYEDVEEADGSCQNKVTEVSEFFTFEKIYPGQGYVIEIIVDNKGNQDNLLMNFALEFKDINKVKQFILLKAEQIERQQVGEPGIIIEDITAEAEIDPLEDKIQPIKKADIPANQKRILRLTIEFRGVITNEDGEKEYFGKQEEGLYYASGILWFE